MNNQRYSIEVDGIDNIAWAELITQFSDASICQTWAHGEASRRKVSHIILRDETEIGGCCQIALRKLPVVNLCLADIKWGPLYMKEGLVAKSDAIRHLIKAIKQEYSARRRCLIRIEPNATEQRGGEIQKILEEEGFKKEKSVRPYRTFKLDLALSLDELRGNFLQKWRNCLNKAERSGIDIAEGTSTELYDTFMTVAREMVLRKKLPRAHIDAFRGYRRIQENLPEPLKMKIIVGYKEDEPVGAAICSAIGDTGIYLFGATAQKGLNINASYLLQWRVIQWLKEKGVRYYDLGAFNRELNPGVFHFKQGIAGKQGLEEIFVGIFFGNFYLSSRVAKFFINSSRFLQKARRTFTG